MDEFERSLGKSVKNPLDINSERINKDQSSGVGNHQCSKGSSKPATGDENNLNLAANNLSGALNIKNVAADSQLGGITISHGHHH